jgi:type II secretory pathway pseudopilin PulG
MSGRCAGRSPHGNLSAYTIIELLVCAAVISLLAGLVLPAVQSAREASRRLSCSSNLRQTGLAISHYLDAHNALPPCMLPEQMRRGTSGVSVIFANCYSPFARMLPEVELQTVYNGINFALLPDFAPGLWANRTAMGVSANAFLCPSEASLAPRGYGRMNYHYCIGPMTFLRERPNAKEDQALNAMQGAFTTGRTLSAADFTDGRRFRSVARLPLMRLARLSRAVAKAGSLADSTSAGTTTALLRTRGGRTAALPRMSVQCMTDTWLMECSLLRSIQTPTSGCVASTQQGAVQPVHQP